MNSHPRTIKQTTTIKPRAAKMLVVHLAKIALVICAALCWHSKAFASEASGATKLLLNGSAEADSQWRFIEREPQDQVQFPDLNDPAWAPIDVPGDVNAALLKLKRIPDPNFDTQATEAHWITEKEWWYRRKFDAGIALERSNDLVLDGVDGTADVWLNGKKLGTMKDYFCPHRFSVNGVLKTKDNLLLVRFQSINKLLGGKRDLYADNRSRLARFNELMGGKREDDLKEVTGWSGQRGAFLRKPQYNFGIDWALPLPGIGLGGDVWLEAGNELRLEEFALQTFKSGRVDFNFQVSSQAKKMGYKINLHVSGHGADITNTVAKNAHKSYCTINIPNPQLWFPSGYGEPNLYDYSIELVVNGCVVDSRKGKFGIRETRIQENPFTPEAGPGMSFNIVINDEPVLCKGANWIPMEIWPGTIDPSKYEFYLRKFKEANFNMIRVWGGGIYENDKFYQFCDEQGIMVWQDFMFMSAGYPLDLLRDEIVTEADYQIKRLRTHPSVVLWCGINEDVYSWSYTATTKKQENTQADIQVQKTTGKEKQRKVDRYKVDRLLFHIMLRGMVDDLGLGVPYVASSPASRDDVGNYPASGNHQLSVWKYALFQAPEHPETYRKYFDTHCSFDSEFCDQGPCNEKVIRQFMAPENQWPPNNAWILHIQRGHRDIPHFEQTLLIAGGIFGKINTLQEYVKHGQATHLEQTRDEYEGFRSDRLNTGGGMSWMFNDCWPTANWSIVDYYRQPKPAYYAAKRACVPVLPIIFERKGQIGFFVGNDTLTNHNVSLSYGQESLDGMEIWKKNGSFEIAKNSTFKFDRVQREQLRINSGDYLFIDATINGRKADKVIWFPNGWKGIAWPEPKIRVELCDQRKQGDQWLSTLKVSTDKFARLCHLIWKKSPEVLNANQNPDVWFSDNYFDLLAKGERYVLVKSKNKLDLDQIQAGNWLTRWQ